jgi:CRISPR-associated Cas5-like protein
VTPALEITVTVPVVSFRNPLYAGVQVCLPCPPPSTVGGFLASTIGGWHRMRPGTRFAMAFSAKGRGTDVETYHPLGAGGAATNAVPKDREFLVAATLTIWLIEELDRWEAALRRPVWPLRIGRSQDLASARTRRVILARGAGKQLQAVVPAPVALAGTLLQLPTAISEDRSRTRWDPYRYAPTGGDREVSGDYVADDGQVVALLPTTHPSLVQVPALPWAHWIRPGQRAGVGPVTCAANC